MKLFALSSIVLGLMAAPALASEVDDPFGGRTAHNAPIIAQAQDVDYTSTASIDQAPVLATGETAEMVFNRFNR